MRYDQSLQAAISALHSKQIFFVGGGVKSGTTWLQLLLDAHPDVSCGGEAHLISCFAPLLHAALAKHNAYIAEKNGSIFNELRGYSGFTDQHFMCLLASAIALLLEQQARNRCVRAVGEKTPDNINAFGVLACLFPDAKFIHMVRDGRDCAVSCWFHNLRVTPGWMQKNFGSMTAYVENFAALWAHSLRTGAEFGAKNPQQYRVFRYEDLISNPHETLHGIFEFLNVAADRETLEKCCSDGAFSRLSNGRAPGEESCKSFFRKGVVGDWSNHFDDKMRANFQASAGEWLEHFNYT